MQILVRIVTKDHVSINAKVAKGNMDNEGLIRRLRRQQLININKKA